MRLRMLLAPAQLAEHVGQLYRFINVQRLHQAGAHVGIRVVQQGPVEAVEMEDADDPGRLHRAVPSISYWGS